jgi:hypothetical protein
VNDPRPNVALAALLAALLLACAGAPAARAGEGLFLSWSDCVLGTYSQDLSSGCDTNLGNQKLFCAFQMPFAADSVLGLELVVDVQHSEATLPAWWQFAPGGCRAGCLRPAFDFAGRTACRDFLLGRATGGLQGYTVGAPRGGANQARIEMAAAVLPTLGYATLNATDLYYAVELSIVNDFSTGATACGGCSGSACLVLNTILVLRQPGTAGGDISLTTPGPGGANMATWQGGGGASCFAVPARRATWGQIKGLYR